MKLPNPETAAAKIKKRSPLRPTLAVVLGSGFHSAADALEVDCEPSWRKSGKYSD